MDIETIIKRFEHPDETRIMTKGRFDIIHIGGMTIGRATYEAGWKWSEHVGKAQGLSHCIVPHIGMVISGCATAALEGGEVVEMRAGDLFHVPEHPHDSWVVGNEPYVSLHFMGASAYASQNDG